MVHAAGNAADGNPAKRDHVRVGPMTGPGDTFPLAEQFELRIDLLPFVPEVAGTVLLGVVGLPASAAVNEDLSIGVRALTVSLGMPRIMCTPNFKPIACA